MADNHLTFHIGSDCDAGGFVKARNMVSDINKQAKGSGEVFAKLGSVFGQLDGKAAQAAGAITSLLNAFMTMNPVILGVTAAISALTWGFQQVKKAEEEAKKAVEDHRKSMEALLTKVNTGCFDAAVSGAKKLGEEYARITKHANEMTAAMRALDEQKAEGGILQLQAEKIVAVFSAASDEAKQLVEAEYNLKIATQEAANSRQKATSSLSAAHQAVIDKEGEIANLTQQRAKMEEQLIRMKENNQAVELAEKSVRDAVLKQIDDLNNKMLEVDGKILTAKESLEVLHVKESTAKESLANAEEAAAQKILLAEQKQDILNKAIEERTLAEEQAKFDAEIAADKEEARLRAQEDRIALDKEAADIQKEVNSSAKDLKDAEAEYAAALRKYEANFATNKMMEALLNPKTVLGGGGGLDAAMTEQAVRNALANGDIKTVAELNKFQKDAQRAARDEITKTQTRVQREVKQYEKLKDINPKVLSQRDKDFIKNFEAVQQAALAQKQDLDEKKARLDAAKRLNEENNKNLKDIAEKMKLLGLK